MTSSTLEHKVREILNKVRDFYQHPQENIGGELSTKEATTALLALFKEEQERLRSMLSKQHNQETKELVEALKLAKEWIDIDFNFDEKGWPKHDCEFLGNPEKGECLVCSDYGTLIDVLEKWRSK